MITLAEFVLVLDESGISIDPDKLQADKSFADNGVDSLDVMSLFLHVEEKYNVKFPDDEVPNILTPNQLLRHLNSLLASSSS